MQSVVELGHDTYLVGRKKIIFGTKPGTFDVPDRDEVLSRLARKSRACRVDSVTADGFGQAYGFSPIVDDPDGARYMFSMQHYVEDSPEDVKAALRKEFPEHAGKISSGHARKNDDMITGGDSRWAASGNARNAGSAPCGSRA